LSKKTGYTAASAGYEVTRGVQSLDWRVMESVSSISAATSAAEFRPKTEPIRPLGWWPEAVVAFGLGLSVAWTCLLGYGLIKLFWH
jgi:hypothetical protein